MLLNIVQQLRYLAPNEVMGPIFLVGNPGTGKDTTAETFVDALNRREGASNEHLFRLPIITYEEQVMQLTGAGPGLVNANAVPPFVWGLLFYRLSLLTSTPCKARGFLG